MFDLPRRLKGQVTMNRAPHVLLVPQALNPHGRYLRGVLRNQLVERLPLPEGVVSGMFDHLLSPRQLIEAMQASISASRPRPAEGFIVVVGIAIHGLTFILLGRLPGGVIEVGLTERAVVKPVIAHPSVYHGTLRSSDLQG